MTLTPGPGNTLRLTEGRITGTPDVMALIGAAYGQPGVIVIPLDRLDPGYLDLRTGMMGELAQKLTNYGLRLALVGDTAAAETSRAFRDFRRETNQGRTLVILPDEAALTAWL